MNDEFDFDDDEVVWWEDDFSITPEDCDNHGEHVRVFSYSTVCNTCGFAI